MQAEQSEEQPLWILWVVWPLMPASFTGVLFAIKAVLYLWEPGLAAMLPAGTVVWAGVGLGLMYALVLSSTMWTDLLEHGSRRKKNIGLVTIKSSLFIAGVFYVALYSIKVYPVLSQAWGGGRPEVVTVWVAQGDLPSTEEMRRRLPQTSISQQGAVVRVGGARALRTGDDLILLSGSGASVQGVALPMQSLKMVAWGPGE